MGDRQVEGRESFECRDLRFEDDIVGHLHAAFRRTEAFAGVGNGHQAGFAVELRHGELHPHLPLRVRALDTAPVGE